MNSQHRIQYLIAILILVALNILGGLIYQQWDLTEDKRYTLTRPTVELLEGMDESMYVQILLDGELPAGFKRLREAAGNMLNEFRRKNGLIAYRFENPQEGTIQERNAQAEQLAKDGIIPTRLRIREAGEAKEKLIYPYALFFYGSEMYAVNLLENERPGVDNEWILNNSIGLLEYKFANAIQKLQQSSRANIVFTSGHGELEVVQTAFVEQELRKHYNTARVDLDTVITIPDEIDLVIVAKPYAPFSDKELFILDQYVVNGGNAIFLIDQLNVGLDSFSQTNSYIPQAFDLNLDPLLFKYGARINPDLVLDLECTRIPMVVGQVGERVQTELFPWFYHPLIAARTEHPITKNIDRVNLHFPSSIDTIQTRADIRKTILLKSSEYTRIQRIPVRLNFEILRYEPDASQFDKGPLTTALLLEGEQVSLFENRVSDEMRGLLQQAGAEYRTQHLPSKVLVASDGDLIKNLYSAESGEFRELGYNKFENFVFQGNQDFMFNAIEYMLDQDGIFAARSKEVQLRMLDTVNARTNALKWQLLNILVPLIVIIFAVTGFNLWRKKT
ncbi:MAG: gliding motility-associated ABC transporter substrate-binding protein GldG, partial [Saprospiraceae bacterium]|nr:gliding motility-associated ABC transporter substrate-binding protein GldG [Saprospiraceae bacterium]